MSIAPPPIGQGHVDDEFHVPASDDPEWTETCWFTFAVPDRSLSVQFYPYFRPNLGVAAGAVYIWDGASDDPSTCRYAKNFWHLPMPTTPLTGLSLANGITYRCVEALTKYRVGYTDPDGGDLRMTLDVTCLHEPLVLHTHFDQATRATGTILIDGETIDVDCVGFRDRSWGVRTQFGSTVMGPARHASYTWAVADDGDGFFTMCGDFGTGLQNVHGYLRRDGVLSPLVSGTRRVVERSHDRHYPTRVIIEGTDAEGRSFAAEGRALNGLGWFINPNLYTVNGLFAWDIQAGTAGGAAIGEDHDNWSAASIRDFHRS